MKRIIKMKEIQKDTCIIGIDGKSYEIKGKTNSFSPDFYYEITFSDGGTILADKMHQWDIIYNGNRYTIETDFLYLAINNETDDNQGFTKIVKEGSIGIEGGLKIEGIRMIKNTDNLEFSCISVDSPHNNFAILTSKGNIAYTHNCAMRIVCGRLGTIASVMALGSTVATTINGERKGAGIISSQGSMDNIQYYYADHSWIVDYFKDRGLDKFGYAIDNATATDDLEMLENLEGEEEITIKEDSMEFEFDGVKAKVEKKVNQKFEEI